MSSFEPQSRRFRQRNDAFECLQCRKPVPPSDRTSRNHCPYCLYSLHVDINPGDRAHSCGGQLQPFAYQLHSKKGLCIWFRCLTCGEQRRNMALLEGERIPDQYDQILALSGCAPLTPFIPD